MSPSGNVELGGDVDRGFHGAASRFLMALDVGLRQVQLYEPDNKNVNEPLVRLARALEDVLREHPEFTFQGRDQSIFVNGQRLRCDGPTFIRHQECLKLIGVRKIAGIALRAALDVNEWGQALYAIARFDRESSTPFEDAREAIRQRGLAEKIDLLPPQEGRAATAKGVMRVQVERRAFAVRAYAKAMLLLKLYIRHLDDPAHRSYYHLKLQRAVQDLVTVCVEHGWKYFGLVNAKHYEEYLYNHSTNVAVLSLVTGVQLGLKRVRLVELGMAGMLHDLGKALLPKELLEKPGAYTDEERAQLGKHPMLGVDALLRVRAYNEGLLKRIMVICEHHQALREGSDYHPYSRIVAVAEAFDALTSHRPYRPAFLPDDAIKTLLRMAGKRLDRDVVHAFVQTVGLYPAGSVVELNRGHLAIVFHPHPDPKQWKSPVVRLVRDESGNEVPRAPLVDLSERTGEGAPRRWIVRCIDPQAVGINVSGYLYTEAADRTKARA
jgi:HD-GYP domain-containing protein (c-di-GMP phosphodiesterase class II)